MDKIKEIYQYKEMLKNLVIRDLKSRYEGSILGFFWMLVNPLLQIAVYTIVFSMILKTGVDKFYLFLFVAMVPWIFFSTCLTGGSCTVLNSQDMIKKIYFPREIIPLSYTISQFINMVFSFIVILVIVLLSGVKITFTAIFMLPIIMIIELLMGISVTLIVSSLTVYYRDLQQILTIISMVWMYMTPILYPIEFVPDNLLFICELNPMTPIVIAYRDILYYGRFPEVITLIKATSIGLVSIIVGELIFNKLQREFAEEL